MPNIHIVNTGQKVETDLVRSILVSLQLHAVPIMATCGGRAQCGKCVVRIVKGSQYVTKKAASEAERLTAIGADDACRLACQTYTRGDVEIEILNMQETAT